MHKYNAISKELYELLQKLHLEKQKNFSGKSVNFSGNDPILYFEENKC